jgi:uncharacterized membrane protein
MRYSILLLIFLFFTLHAQTEKNTKGFIETSTSTLTKNNFSYSIQQAEEIRQTTAEQPTISISKETLPTYHE